MPWVCWAFGNVSRPILRPILLRLLLKHFMRQNQDKVLLVHISTGRTLWVIDLTLIFYFEIYEIPRLFSRPKFLRPISRLFLEQIFPDQYWDFETKDFETDSETFFRPNIFETDTEPFFWDWKFSRPIRRLFFVAKFFENDTDTLKKIKKMRKVTIPRSLEIRCHTLNTSPRGN